MNKKEPVKKKGATAKKIAIKAKSKQGPARKKRVAVSNIKTGKKIMAKKTVKKERKKVEVKTKKIKLKGNAKNKEPKKIMSKREEETKKTTVKRTEKKATSFPDKKVEVKKFTTKLQKKVTAKRVDLSEKTIPKTPENFLLPGKEERYPPLPVDILSEEYGNSSIALMIVDPKKLFIYWEVIEDTFEEYAGTLEIRLYDITGMDFDGMLKNYVDIAIHDRIGNMYLDVDPEKEFIADIGIIDSVGSFVILARSNKALTPPTEVIAKGILPQRLYETGIEKDFSIPPIGYER